MLAFDKDIDTCMLGRKDDTNAATIHVYMSLSHGIIHVSMLLSHANIHVSMSVFHANIQCWHGMMT
jgi:hypothetical protein